MRFENLKVWNGKSFVKGNLAFKNGIFVNSKIDTDPVVDATGLFALPGFVDSHAHVMGVGMKKISFDLTKSNIYNDIVNSLNSEKREFVLGRGWENIAEIENISFFNKQKLPIVFVRKCGHVVWVNRYVMNRLNFENNIIYESQIEKVWELLGVFLYDKAFDIGQEEFLKYGITSVHSDDFHGITFQKLKEKLSQSKLRIFEKLYTFEPWKYEYGTFGISKIGGFKIFADGSLGAKTAYMIKPYKGSDLLGMNTLPENITEIVKFAKQNNLQINIHAIGDRAVKEVLDLFEKYSVENGRLIHVQFLREVDIQRIKKYFISVQPHFYFEDLKLLETVEYENGYPFKKLYELGCKLAFSSDAPVSPHDPKYVIEAGVKMGFTLEECVKLYTESGSEFSGEDTGSLSIGKRADFALYDGDFLEKEPIAVFVDGKLVYGNV